MNKCFLLILLLTLIGCADSDDQSDCPCKYYSEVGYNYKSCEIDRIQEQNDGNLFDGRLSPEQEEALYEEYGCQ